MPTRISANLMDSEANSSLPCSESGESKDMGQIYFMYFYFQLYYPNFVTELNFTCFLAHGRWQARK